MGAGGRNWEDARDVVACGADEALGAEIAACRRCRDAPMMRHPLPHEPRPVLRISSTARVAICGQAPGTRVHASGLPFDDPSGDRLRDWMGIGRDVFYDATRVAVVPMGFCFPGQDAKGGDLPPRRECRQLWHDRVFAAMPQLDLVLAIGAYAQAYHLGKAVRPSLTETVTAWRDYWEIPGPRHILPLPHPSWRNTGWLKRNPWFDRDLAPFLKKEIRKRVAADPDQGA